MNVHHYLKPYSVDEIKSYYKTKTIPAAAAMMHVKGDFNLATLIRNVNFFGFEKVFYIGGDKKYDRRGTVGTHHYVDLNFIKSEKEFVSVVKDLGYTILAIENNINYVVEDFFTFFNVSRDIKPIFVFGEEQRGLSDFMLANSQQILHIRGRGTVRSLNVGTASGIVSSGYKTSSAYVGVGMAGSGSQTMAASD